MSEAKQMLFAKNLINICVESNNNGDFQGVLWHQYADDPIEFVSVINLLTIIDDLLDDWDFPQKSLDPRSFKGVKANQNKRQTLDEELSVDKLAQANGVRNIQNKTGKLGNFILHVAYRQNATWQGQVVVGKSNEKKDFASAMDLLRIMDSELNQ